MAIVAAICASQALAQQQDEGPPDAFSGDTTEESNYLLGAMMVAGAYISATIDWFKTPAAAVCDWRRGPEFTSCVNAHFQVGDSVDDLARFLVEGHGFTDLRDVHEGRKTAYIYRDPAIRVTPYRALVVAYYDEAGRITELIAD